jgi:hypothetical protein
MGNFNIDLRPHGHIPSSYPKDLPKLQGIKARHKRRDLWSEVTGFHGSENSYCGLLGYDTVQSGFGRYTPK